MKKWTLLTALLGLTLWVAPVSAEEQGRWSVNAYTGANLIFPLVGASVGYEPAHLPFEFGATVTLNTLLAKTPSSPSMMPMGTLYGKLYFTPYDPLERTTFRTFAQLDLGAGYVLNVLNTGPETSILPTIMAGLGFDWMPWEHVGFTAALKTGFNQHVSFLAPGLMVRPELGMRFVWS